MNRPAALTPHTYWEDTSNMQPVKFESCNSNDGEQHPPLKDEPNSIYRFCDGNLNFATVACSEDDSEYGHFHKKNKVSRQDPMSHRIIEKRRRDRMNNCLADLSRLIPADYLKKGRGRIEKTEIIEMAIKHMKYLQQNYQNQSINTQHYRLGFQECLSETMRFLVEVEGFFARESLCVKLISHLQAHCEAVISSDRLHVPTANVQSTTGPPPVNGTNNTTVPLPPPQLRSPIQNRPTPSPQNGIHESVNGYEPNPSQLRDMLSSTKEVQMQMSRPIEIREHSPSSTVSKHDYSRNMNEQIMYEYQRAQQQDVREEGLSQNENNNMYVMQEQSQTDIENNNRECGNGSLYKFKNNIMQRISQESVTSSLSSHNINKLYKRRKMEMHEQSSVIGTSSMTTENYCYSENHSPTDNSQTSPSSSDVYTRVSSESDNPHRGSSPTGSSVSDNKHHIQSPKRHFSPNFPKTQISRSSHEIIKPNYNNRYSPNRVVQVNNSNTRNNVNKVIYSKDKPNFSVPIFVLHAKGSFYIPLTIDYNTLAPYLANYNILEVVPTLHSMVLHPVTINVNFHPNSISNPCASVVPKQKYKTENGWH